MQSLHDKFWRDLVGVLEIGDSLSDFEDAEIRTRWELELFGGIVQNVFSF